MRNKKSIRARVICWRVIAAAALITALGCFGYAGWYHWSLWQTNRQREMLQETVVQTEQETERPEELTLEQIEQMAFTGEYDGPAPVLPEEVKREDAAVPIDFEKLSSYNPELYAWIRIPDTQIDYPVAQHAGEDQRYYLHHDLYGQPQFAGCIFTEEPAAPDFSDPVTILYGHNMKNGSMFQNLHLFLDASFFEAHPYLYVYTKEQAYKYHIYAVYPYDDRHLANTFDFSSDEDLKIYLDGTMHPRSMEAQVDPAARVTKEDHILTLSTCIAGAPSSRLLLQAVREDT